MEPPASPGARWIRTALHGFTSSNTLPFGNLAVDSRGRIYGATGGEEEAEPVFSSIYQVIP